MKRLLLWAGVLSMNLATGAGAAELRGVEELTDVRGSIVFRTYCMLCHGQYADGKGRAARNYNPPPANLTTTTVSDAYKELIIRKGGAVLGRSPFMPPWEHELTDEQIRDVIAYLRVIKVNQKAASN